MAFGQRVETVSKLWRLKRLSLIVRANRRKNGDSTLLYSDGTSSEITVVLSQVRKVRICLTILLVFTVAHVPIHVDRVGNHRVRSDDLLQHCCFGSLVRMFRD